MKWIYDALKRAFSYTALVFASLVTAFNALGNVFAMAGQHPYLDSAVVDRLLIFSAVFGVLSVLMLIPKIPYVLTLLVHFAGSAVAYFFCLVRMTERSENNMFMAVGLFIVLYWAIYGILKGFYALCHRKPKEETEI